MSKLTQKTAISLMPENLRTEFGIMVGTEVAKLLLVIDKSEESVSKLFHSLHVVDTDKKRMCIIEAVWRHYYDNVAEDILKPAD